MVLVNVTQCDVDVEASQKSDVTVLTKKSGDSEFLDTSFLDLPFELQCQLLRETSAAEIRELKAVSRQLKRLIERHWRPAFYILPPKIQIKILTEAQMTSSEIRHLKLVSKDMKYLIERGGQHLTKHNFVPGAFTISTENISLDEAVSFEDFFRNFTHCHFGSIWIREINLTLDFCDRLQDDFRENRITCDMLLFNSCNIYDEDILTIVDKLLGATEANQFNILESRNRNFRFKKEFFWMPSVRKLAELGLAGECDFSDDDLLSTDYRILYLERCRISEYALRQFLEELLDSKRNIVIVKFKVQNAIDVDRLLNALSNIERTAERQWNLRNVRGRIMEIRIENDFFSCETI